MFDRQCVCVRVRVGPEYKPAGAARRSRTAC